MRYNYFYIINILIIYSFFWISHLIQVSNEKNKFIYYLKYIAFSRIKFHILLDDNITAHNSQLIVYQSID